MVKVRIIPSRCIGCAACTMNAPEIFMIGEHGHSVIREKFRLGSETEGEVPDELKEKVLKARNLCPCSAIEVLE